MKKNLKKLTKNSVKDIKKVWEDSKTDPLGSYTGTDYDKKRPVQDADDL